MILPIYVYGQPVLRKKAAEIKKDHPGLKETIANMWETLPVSDGVGLAAPQIGQSIRLFIIDSTPFAEDHPEADGFHKTFINPVILERSGEDAKYNEGCLSLPGIHEDVTRKSRIRIKYQDEDFKTHEKEYDGIIARIIQHEYDHVEGKMFIDHLTMIRRRILKPKLETIALGKVEVTYKIKIAK